MFDAGPQMHCDRDQVATVARSRQGEGIRPTHLPGRATPHFVCEARTRTASSSRSRARRPPTRTRRRRRGKELREGLPARRTRRRRRHGSPKAGSKTMFFALAKKIAGPATPKGARSRTAPAGVRCLPSAAGAAVLYWNIGQAGRGERSPPPGRGHRHRRTEARHRSKPGRAPVLRLPSSIKQTQQLLARRAQESGSRPRFPRSAADTCWRHASKASAFITASPADPAVPSRPVPARRRRRRGRLPRNTWPVAGLDGIQVTSTAGRLLVYADMVATAYAATCPATTGRSPGPMQLAGFRAGRPLHRAAPRPMRCWAGVGPRRRRASSPGRSLGKPLAPGYLTAPADAFGLQIAHVGVIGPVKNNISIGGATPCARRPCYTAEPDRVHRVRPAPFHQVAPTGRRLPASSTVFNRRCSWRLSIPSSALLSYRLRHHDVQRRRHPTRGIVGKPTK